MNFEREKVIKNSEFTVDGGRSSAMNDEHPLVTCNHRDEISSQAHNPPLSSCPTQKRQITIGRGNNNISKTIQITVIEVFSTARWWQTTSGNAQDGAFGPQLVFPLQRGSRTAIEPVMHLGWAFVLWFTSKQGASLPYTKKISKSGYWKHGRVAYLDRQGYIRNPPPNGSWPS